MKICVLGAGSWGIALSLHLRLAGHEVSVWEHQPAKAEDLKRKRENPKLLPGVLLPTEVLVGSNLGEVLVGREGVVIALPSHVVGATLAEVRSHLPKGAWVACASKGLEEGTDLRMSEVLKKNLKNEHSITAISGPSHAEEVSKRMPTTVVAASEQPEASRRVQEAFHSDYFRVYTSSDLLGVELAGALKNVIAIAAGITDGLGLGDNSKAAIMTRGLHEMTRLGLAMGAQAPTFAGLAGMGDLIVTCTSRHSRNRLLGEKLGKGTSIDQALGEMVMVAEGVRTSRAAVDLAQKYRIEMPITQEVFAVLFKGKSAKEAAKSLLSRSAKAENEY